MQNYTDYLDIASNNYYLIIYIQSFLFWGYLHLQRTFCYQWLSCDLQAVEQELEGKGINVISVFDNTFPVVGVKLKNLLNNARLSKLLVVL